MLAELLEEVDSSGEMPPLAQMGLMLVDWLDPEKGGVSGGDEWM
jgi:hypothetical protein